MKILGLCFLLFVCLAPASRAQSPNQGSLNLPKSDQVTAQDSQFIDHLLLPKDSLPEDSLPRDSQSPWYLRLHNPELYGGLPDGEPYCAYMRTYRVRREYRNSDVVSPAGYTTCVPGKRFQVRSAVETRTESDRDK